MRRRLVRRAAGAITRPQVPIAYALNVAVPHGSEDDFLETAPTFTGRLALAFEENLHRLPITTRRSRFRKDEDPTAYVMKRLGDVYPKINNPWPDKHSDEALTKFCLYGLGAHRVKREGDAFVVRTNIMARLPVREGLERYGGDAYFDAATWRVRKIVRIEATKDGDDAEVAYVGGADISSTNRGAAAALFRGDASRRCRGRDVESPRRFRGRDVENGAQVRAGGRGLDLRKVLLPVVAILTCYARGPLVWSASRRGQQRRDGVARVPRRGPPHPALPRAIFISNNHRER